MLTVDVFWRTMNRDPERQARAANVRHLRLALNGEPALPEILAAAIRAGASKGSSTSGIFEVQTRAGIWVLWSYLRGLGRRTQNRIRAFPCAPVRPRGRRSSSAAVAPGPVAGVLKLALQTIVFML